MDFIQENPVFSITIIIMAIYLFITHIRERLIFLSKSNLKYHILDYLAAYIYYGADIGVTASLSLDEPSSEVLERRLRGQAYLKSKLGDGDKLNQRGVELSSKLVDCRFALAKVCMPLLRELEFGPPRRNFITEVTTDKGMHQVHVGDKTSQPLLYCGSDAVHTLGVEDFHAPLQKEINSRMDLIGKKGKDSNLRFAPIALNTELEKNANMILKMTGMDQV